MEKLLEMIEDYKIDGVVFHACRSCRATTIGQTHIKSELGKYSDLPMMQLVSDKVQFYDFESGTKGKPGYRPERKIDRQGVIDYFGVPPEKVIEVQALVGDTSDNVPGVPGIGDNGARERVARLGHVDRIIENADAIPHSRTREAIRNNPDSALLSLDLVRLDRDVDVAVDYPDIAMREMDRPRLVRLFSELVLARS